jgi:hypothetical protein
MSRNRITGFEEQALPAAIYTPLAPLLNFFMPGRKLVRKNERNEPGLTRKLAVSRPAFAFSP